MPFWTYMLHCRGGKLYTGHTDDLERRVAQHKTGAIAGFTRDHLPVELVWSQEFVTREEAKAAELQIKGWSKAKKLALIRGDWGRISHLARNRQITTSVRPELVEGLPSSLDQTSLIELASEAKEQGSPSTSSGQSGVVLTDAAAEQIRTHARLTAPLECCGLLLGVGTTITEARPARNVHLSPQTHFEIDPQAMIDAHRAARAGGPQVLGYYHSHPRGPAQPSATDRAMAARDGAIWAIVTGDEITFWRDDESCFTPLSYRLAKG